MKTEAKASLLIRSLLRNQSLSEHIVLPKDSDPISSDRVLVELDDGRRPMAELLHTMFEGWIQHEEDLKADEQAQIEESMIKVCGGDQMAGCLLALFSHWSNDVSSIAAHYGIVLARRQPDGTLLHDDGTVDTLCKGGVLEIVYIGPAPSREHYWHKGQWNAPDEFKDGLDAPVDQDAARAEGGI